MASHWGDYCSFCGLALNGDFPRRCDNGHYTYASPVTVAVALQPVQSDTRTGILVVQRGIEPHKGEYALPGGFVDPRETAIIAAPRELYEETGIRHNDAPVYFCEDIGWSHSDKDPRSHAMYFYAMPSLQENAVDFTAGSAETQNLDLVYLAADNASLCDRNGHTVTLCFSTHHNAAVNFLKAY